MDSVRISADQFCSRGLEFMGPTFYAPPPPPTPESTLLGVGGAFKRGGRGYYIPTSKGFKIDTPSLPSGPNGVRGWAHMICPWIMNLVVRIARPTSLAIWHRGCSHRRPNRSWSPNRRHFASLDLKKHPDLSHRRPTSQALFWHFPVISDQANVFSHR